MTTVLLESAEGTKRPQKLFQKACQFSEVIFLSFPRSMAYVLNHPMTGNCISINVCPKSLSLLFVLSDVIYHSNKHYCCRPRTAAFNKSYAIHGPFTDLDLTQKSVVDCINRYSAFLYWLNMVLLLFTYVLPLACRLTLLQALGPRTPL